MIDVTVANFEAEVIEASTGNRVDGAWWLARPEGPGVLIGMKGLEYEQILWQSPVNYVRRSRGLGPKTSTVKRKQKDGTVKVVKVQNGRYHYGVDMTAPKGTDVHAVADGVDAAAAAQAEPTRGRGVLLGLGEQHVGHPPA